MKDTNKADKYDLCWKVINTVRVAKGLPMTPYSNKYREVISDDIMVILKGSPRPEDAEEPEKIQTT